MEKIKQFANVFGNEPDISFEEKMRVVNELNKVGSLNFTVEKSEDGWMAECAEVPSIITGNSNPSPSNFEIESLIREAIFSAFGVHFQVKSELAPSPLQFQFSALAA
jgi:hypothetical protein